MTNPNDNATPAPVNGSQPATPSANADGQSGGMSVNELAKKVEDMEKRLSEKDRYIGELSSEKETLAQRISQMSQPPESTTPATAPTLNPRDIATLVDQQTYVNEIRKSNSDLIEIGLEPMITQDADKFIRQGMTFRDAIDKAVRLRREVVDKKLKPAQSVPTGAMGESPANTTPPQPPPPVEKPIEDEGDARAARRARLGL